MAGNSVPDRIRRMAAAAEKAAAGDFSARMECSGDNDELDSLARSFNEIVRRGRAHHVLDCAREQVFWLAEDGSFLYVNDAACRSLGYASEELLRMTVFDINPHAERERYPSLWRKVREKGFDFFETEHKTRDGRVFPVEIGVTVVRFGEEEFQCAFVRDVSERKKFEEALRENAYFLRKSQEVARLGSYKMNVASGKWIGSHTLDEIFGIGDDYPKDVEGWLAIIVPEQREEMRKYLATHVLSEGNRFEREYRIIRRSDGKVRWVFGMGELDLDERGKPVRMIGTIQDVTERKRAETEREELEERLRHAEKMDSVGRLAGGVAHDFNNMLAVILGYSELMRTRLPAGDPIVKFVTEIEKAANRSRDITRQLLAFSQKQIIAPRVVDLNGLLEVAGKTLGRLIGEDITLRFSFGNDLWPIRIDPAQFDQVLVSLALNARDAMPNGGRLTIGTGNVRLEGALSPDDVGFEPGDYVCLAVTDEGVGMDRETLSHVFEPFFTTKEVGKGTGLGLSTVYGIVEQNGGFIRTSSEPGKGTTFRIYIPRLPDARDSGDAPDMPGKAASDARAASVLLVEDDELVRRMASRMLEDLGYKVLVAESPFDALSLCGNKDLSVDLLITDVVMPGMNGRVLSENVEELKPGIGVLFMSGYTRDVIADRGIVKDGAHFLNKPFTKQGLAQAVREAIARR